MSCNRICSVISGLILILELNRYMYDVKIVRYTGTSFSNRGHFSYRGDHISTDTKYQIQLLTKKMNKLKRKDKNIIKEEPNMYLLSNIINCQPIHTTNSGCTE